MNRKEHRDELANRWLSVRRRLKKWIVFLGVGLLTLTSVTLSSAASIQPLKLLERYVSVAQQSQSAQQGQSAQHYLSADLIALSEDAAYSALADNPLASDSITTLLSEGLRYYESGQLAAALQSWQQVVEIDAQPLHQALALSYVSLAAQDLGEWEQAETAIARSLTLLADSASTDEESLKVHAQVLNMQGRLSFKKGSPEAAWETWQTAERAYDRANDWLGRVGSQINQAQALQTMGLYRRAGMELSEIIQSLAAQPDSAVKAIALRSLGRVLQTTGSLEQAEQHLTQSLKISERLGDRMDTANTLFAIAHTQRLMGQTQAALQNYKKVEDRAIQAPLRAMAKLSQFDLLLKDQQWEIARQLLSEIYAELPALPASREAINSRVMLSESLLVHRKDNPQIAEWLSVEEIAALLSEASQQAAFLQDDRAQSLALGELSKVYGYAQQWSDSQSLGERALSLSQRINAKDLSYRWQQQLGKTRYQQGDQNGAIARYSDAVNTLGEVRRDLLATNSDVQYSFRETVEPVYRELVGLLLLPDEVSQERLMQAREVVEELQLAELENYFRSACIDSSAEYIDKLDSEAAVIYPIILSDRIEVIVSLPNQPLRHYRTWQSEESTHQVITELFENFNPALSSRERLNLSQQIYGWLIQPTESELQENNISTLVFVLDGGLRNIPMAALYDGSQYLLEKYSISLTPGLKLLGPHFQDPKPLQALMMGITEARSGFSALPGVKAEIEQVSARVSSEVLFDQEFTKNNLEMELKRVPFPVLHLATHGQFSSNLEETFLLTWDQKLTIGDLDSLLRSRRQQLEPIELMVLSACQTAEGDDRAALGLAGMAIRSGARSTLATLWAVNDESTAALMTQFYQELSSADLSKAEALRLAQIKILQTPEFSHPFYWSPFVLIGNWLS